MPIPAPILIAGMGPGGLTAALEAAKKGIPVVIVEPRQAFSRIQRLHIDHATLSYLESFRDPNDPHDTHFFEHQLEVVDGEKTIQTKDIQAFLARKLRAYPTGQVTIIQGDQASIEAIDPVQQVAQIKKADGSSMQMNFSHVIVADGARRGVTAKLNQRVTQDEMKIKYQENPLQPRQTEVGTVSLVVKPSIKLTSAKTDQRFNASHMRTLQKLGWDQPYFPKCYVFKNKGNTKFFISGEIPKSILRMRDKGGRPDIAAQRQALEQWGKFVASVRMGCSPEELELREKLETDPHKIERTRQKNALLTTAFELALRTADKPVVRLGSGGAFALVGDAYKNANFFFGHGMNDAILDGRKVIESIDHETAAFDFKLYSDHQVKQRKRFDMLMSADLCALDLPHITRNLDEGVQNLLKFAGNISNFKVREALADITRRAGPLSPDFDAFLYQAALEELAQAIREFLKSKIQEHSHWGLFHLIKEKKYKNLEAKLDNLLAPINKQLTRYYNTNISQRKTWYQQLTSKLSSSPSA